MRYITLDRSRHVNVLINLLSEQTVCTNTFKVLRLVGVVTFWIILIFASLTWIPSWHTSFSSLPYLAFMTILFTILSYKIGEIWSRLVESCKDLKLMSFFFGTTTKSHTSNPPHDKWNLLQCPPSSLDTIYNNFLFLSHEDI